MRLAVLVPLFLLSFVPFSPISLNSEGDLQEKAEYRALFIPEMKEVLPAPRERVELRVYNSADYISEDPDIIQMFEDYVLEKDGVELEVVYETFDTNETMLSRDIEFHFYDHTARPSGTYTIVLSCSANAYGEYMLGCTSNVLYVDDFEWVY